MLYLIALGLTIIPAFLPLLIVPSGPNSFGPAPEPRTFGAAVMGCLRKYADGNGRAKRSEFWWFYLAPFVFSLAMAFIDNMTGNAGVLTLLFWAYVLPLTFAGVRRLHDINRSGWWMLLILTGLGAIALAVLLVWPSYKDEAAEVF